VRSTDASSKLCAGGLIEGADFRLLQMNADSRGVFTEIYSQDWQSYSPPKQWSVVHSKAGVFRGMHLHLRHDECFALISGRAFVGLLDIRPHSPTNGVRSLYELSATQLACLMFPRGVLHGWYLAEDSCHLQGVSETWRNYRFTDNRGCHWSDPELGIPWPMTTAVISENASAFPSLHELLRQLKADERVNSSVTS
jgi:dTDP-4-dehydrorhamnose 3,5-epimerase